MKNRKIDWSKIVEVEVKDGTSCEGCMFYSSSPLCELAISDRACGWRARKDNKNVIFMEVGDERE